MAEQSDFGWALPEGTDPVAVPADLEALADAIAATLLSNPVGLKAGDLKFSARDDDHDRWLRLDGRGSLSKAEVLEALGLEAGDADALFTVLGTGASSKYGAASTGEIYVPDTRRRIPIAEGAGEDGPAEISEKPAGETGGAESVKLTSAQCGIREHTHGVTDPTHGHTLTDPGHTHAASQASHNHGGVTGETQPSLSISAAYTGCSVVGVGAHLHGLNAANSYGGGGGAAVTGQGTNRTTEWGGEHSHSLSDPTHTHGGSVGKHTHTISSVTPAVTVSSNTTGITMAKVATGLTVNAVASADATSSHSNMPPYIVLGSWFIRV